MYVRIGALLLVLAALSFPFFSSPSEMTHSAQAMQEPTATGRVTASPTPTILPPTVTGELPTATLPAVTPTVPALTPTVAAETPTPISTATAAPTSTATAAPDLTVTLDGSPDVIPDGGVVTYFVTVTNTGNAASTATTLLDQLPPGTGIEAIGPGCSPSPVGISCIVPALQPGQSIAFTFTISAQAGPGTILNTALIDPGNQVTEANESNNGATALTTVVPSAGPIPFPPPQEPFPPVAPAPQPAPPVAVPVPEAPVAAAPPIDVAGVQVVPPAAQSGELWLQVLAPTQAYSVDMDPLWIAMPGEWYIVTQQDGGWALAVWEGDTTGWSVWIPMDEKVLATVVDRADPRISSEVWLVANAPTEAYASGTRQFAWTVSPGEWYRVLQTDGAWALAVYETDPLTASVWIAIDARVQLAPGDAPHSPA